MMEASIPTDQVIVEERRYLLKVERTPRRGAKPPNDWLALHCLEAGPSIYVDGIAHHEYWLLRVFVFVVLLYKRRRTNERICILDYFCVNFSVVLF